MGIMATTRIINHRYRRIETRALTCGCQNHRENIATGRPAAAAAVVATMGITIDTAANRRNSRAITWSNRTRKPE